MHVRRLVFAALVLLLVVACGDEPATEVGAGGTTTTTTTEVPEPDEGSPLEGPPPVELRAGGATLELDPWTWCFRNGCADGMPPDPLPDVGSPDEVAVAFPLDGWTFEATFAPAGAACPRQHTVPVGDDGVLRPAGRAGTYDVTLFGRGAGDLFVSFRWTTTADGPLPVPDARLALIADHDGVPDSYGVELVLTNLATTPASAEATITARAGDGDELSFAATRQPGCLAEGTVSWDGPDEQGKAAAALGPPPFAYEVEVVLDGTRHRASAEWPADEIEGNEPSVALVFEPPLPALR